MEQHDLPSLDGPGPAREAARQNARRYLKKRSDYLSLAIIVNLLLLYLFQTAVGWLVVRAVTTAGLSPGGLELVNECYTIFVYGTAFLLPYLAYARLVGFRPEWIPRDRPHPPVLLASTGVTLSLSVAGLLLSLLISAFFAGFGLYPPDYPLSLPEQPVAAALFFFNMTALPALVEEFTYRGIVLGSLRPWGDRFAVGVSALLFALLHRNMAQFPNALLMGLALGYFMVKTNSLWTSVFIHFANNLLVLLLAAATDGAGYGAAALAELMLMLCYLVLGALGARYFLARRLNMRLSPSGCPLREWECAGRFFLNFPALLLIALYIWVIYLNFA